MPLSGMEASPGQRIVEELVEELEPLGRERIGRRAPGRVLRRAGTRALVSSDSPV